MSGKLGDIAATVSLDIDPFKQSTRILQAQTKGIEKSLRNQERAFKNSGKSINSLKGMYESTGKAVKSYSKLTEDLQKNYERYKKQIGDLNTASDKEISTLMKKEQAYLNSSDKLEQMTAKYNRLGKEMAVQNSKFTKLGDNMQNVGKKISTAGDGMSSFGKKMSIGVTAPITAMSVYAVKAAKDFESAFAGVKKTVNASDEEFAKLEHGIREMAKTMPASAVEIANVAEAAGQLGIHTPNILTFSETMVKMGVATNMSAEEAATAMARFANVMGTNQKDFDRLGSSIVQLGNNFATTESEIMQMGLRLSGVGKQTGMTESAVMGIAAAMSTVGIEAEAGGTAMTQGMKKMQNAVMGGTKELDSFAKTAGMSRDEFSTLFNEDASQALLAYVKGLETASKGGKNLNDVLKDVGISGIRESDAFLRLAGDSDILKRALDQSSTAWDENNALSNEAKQRYETLDSQLQILKNVINDVAIEFGGPLVTALKDGVVAAKPVIETVGKLAKSFSDASPETQQMIMKTIALTAAIGPLSSVFGKITSVVGGGISTLGKFSSFIGSTAKVSKDSANAIDGAGSAIGVFTKGADKATSSVGIFGKSILGLNPWVAGTTLAIGAGVAVWELWGKGAVESAKRTAKWGSDVGEDADKVLTSFQKLTDSTSNSLNTFNGDVENSSKNVKQNISEMVKSIKEDAVKMNEEIDETFNKLPKSIQEATRAAMEEQKKSNNDRVKSAENHEKQIDEIMGNAIKNKRDMTAIERQMFKEHQNQLNIDKVEGMGLGAEEQRSLIAALNHDIENMTKTQRSDAVKNLKIMNQEQVNEMESTNKELKKQYGEDSEAYKTASELNKKYSKEQTMSLASDAYDLMKANGLSSEAITTKLRDMGLSSKEAASIMGGSYNEISESTSLLSESNEKLSESTQKANDSWRDFILDEKTGGVKTNLDEFLTEQAESEEGWDQLTFIAKEANLTSDAKEKVFEAMSETGKWNDMGIPEKLIKADNLEFLIGLSESEGSLNEFNSLDPELKTLIIDGSEKLNADEAKLALQQYDTTNPELKKLLTNNTDTMSNVEAAKSKVIDYDKTNASKKKFTADSSDVRNKSEASKEEINKWNRKEAETKKIKAKNETHTGVESAKKLLDSIKDKTVTILSKFIPSGKKHKNGTDSHPGGDAILGDGGKHEPFLTPQGYFGISPNVDTPYPDLPRGTKVWSSVSKFNREMDKMKDTKALNLINRSDSFNKVNNKSNENIEDTIARVTQKSQNKVINVTQNISSPDALTAREVGRQTKFYLRDVVKEMK